MRTGARTMLCVFLPYNFYSDSRLCKWQTTVDVQFDFFDPNPKVDYQALKRLLMQLFQSDAERLHLNDLTDLILSQPTVGTTIKTDGIDSDPFAVLTVLNMHVHQVCFSPLKTTKGTTNHTFLEPSINTGNQGLRSPQLIT
jgi:protein BCP1